MQNLRKGQLINVFRDCLKQKKRKSCFSGAHTEKAQLPFFSARSQKRLTTHVLKIPS